MDMNTFKPLIQHCEEFYVKILYGFEKISAVRRVSDTGIEEI